MALKITFLGKDVSLPSGDGPRKCENCGGRGYCWYGPNREGKFAFKEICLDCGKSEQNENWPDNKGKG